MQRPRAGGDTWDRQAAPIAKYAKQYGLEVVDEFRDAGVSGTKDLDNRPGLAALLDRVESNGVKIVLVENATRLAHDLMVVLAVRPTLAEVPLADLSLAVRRRRQHEAAAVVRA